MITFTTLIPSFVQDTMKKMGTGRDVVFDSLKRATAFTEEQGEILKRAKVKPTEA